MNHPRTSNFESFDHYSWFTTWLALTHLVSIGALCYVIFQHPIFERQSSNSVQSRTQEELQRVINTPIAIEK